MVKLTTNFGELVPQVISDQMLVKAAEKVFDKAAQHVYIANLSQIGQLLSLRQLIFQLFQLHIRT